METKLTKVCNKCNKDLLLIDFGKNNREDDGLQPTCKSCIKETRGKKAHPGLKKVFTNPNLAAFTPKQLIEELKARGYTGELRFIQKIIF